MSGNVVQLQRLFRRSCDWSSRELAEFYRVEAALIQAGLRIETERGLSDEGDPWFAFCRPDEGEVIVHIARIGDLYVLASPSYDGIASGNDIAELVRDLVSRHPLIQMRGNKNGQVSENGQVSKIFLHPAAILVAVVATAFFKSTEARALSDDHKAAADARAGGGAVALRSDSSLGLECHKTVLLDAAQSAAILSAVAAVLQTPVAAAPSNESTPSNADSLDVSLPTLPASSAQATSEGIKAPNFQPDDAHPTTGPAPSLNATAHLAEALPLIAVLWDLSARPLETKPVGAYEAVPAAAVSLPIEVGQATRAPVVTLKMAPPDTGDLPSVHAAKVSFPTTETTVEMLPKPEQLPAALVNALKDATHNLIDGQLATVVPNESFATSLYSSINGGAPNSAIASPADPGTLQAHPPTATQPSASVEPASASSDLPPKPSIPATAADVTAAVREFLSHISDAKTVVDGNSVVVYDEQVFNLRPTELKTVSFDFSDGSTLSLVGVPAELPHFLHGH
jgi:hypothetical protein